MAFVDEVMRGDPGQAGVDLRERGRALSPRTPGRLVASDTILPRLLDVVLSAPVLSSLRPNVPPARELGYMRSVSRRLRLLVRKSPAAAPLAELNHRLKAWRERRDLYGRHGVRRWS